MKSKCHSQHVHAFRPHEPIFQQAPHEPIFQQAQYVYPTELILKLSPLEHYRQFWGISCLIQNRHADIHQRDKDGYDSIERYLKVLEEISEDYDENLQEYRPVTNAINLELQKNKVH